MKVSCDVIKDLLPLYHDQVCSDESNAIVREHLAECENCKSELQAIGSSIPKCGINQNLNEAESIKNLSRKWRKGIMKSYVKGAVITLLVIIVIALIVYTFVDIRIVYSG